MAVATDTWTVTELEIPPEADDAEAKDLVREFVDVGNEVEIRDEEMTTGGDSGRVRARGEVTGFEPGYLELDGQSLDDGSLRYTEIHTMKRIS